jgi:putative aldouronate transport system permease protein
MNKSKLNRITTFDVVNSALVVMITLLIMYPLYFVIIASFSKPADVMAGETLLWIKNFTTTNYEYLLNEDRLWTGYRNTIVYTALGTLYQLFLTIPTAYVLTKKYLPGRNFVSIFYLLPMYISGGLIPSFILMKNLGMVDNPLILIIGGGISCYNLLIAKQYFATSIPGELYEAAQIDGAPEWKCFTKIAMPLAKPIIAVMALYYGVTHWNSYYNAMIYIREEDFWPLQLVLKEVLISSQDIVIEPGMDMEMMEALMQRLEMVQGMKYAIIFVACLPLLIAYPFVQKYFTKGMMIGAVKG